MILKAVIPVAGLGTRLLPMTKEMPKEMLPIFVRSVNGSPCLKPMVQAVFEQLYDVGFREFEFVVGRGKRAIEDHFTVDWEFVEALERRGKRDRAEELQAFYGRVEGSSIVFINQPEPRGFGDAVLKAKPFISGEFLVHAGDTYIISEGHRHLYRLLGKHGELGSDATLTIQEVEDPRMYGVVEGREVGDGVYRVERAVEKPEKPATNLAIMPLYIFDPRIFKALEEASLGFGGELQLTDGIQGLVKQGLKVNAVMLKPGELRLDIGNPDSCWEALKQSHLQLEGPGR